MPYLIAGIIILVFVTLLLTVFGRKKGTGTGNAESAKSQNQIIRAANKRLAKDPHDPAGLIPMSNVYFLRQLWEKALPMYKDLSKMAPDNSSIDPFEVNLRAGICCIRMENFQESLAYLSAAYNIDSHSYEVNFNLGYSCFKLQQYEKAIPCFKKALVSKSDAEGVYILLGQCYYNTHKYRDSLPCFKKALDEDPQNKEALFDMADAMTQEGHGDKAIKVFMHLRPDPVYGAKSCLEAGLFHKKINDIESAIQDFEIGLKHENADPDVLLEIKYHLASCHFARNQISKGLVLLKVIRNVNSNYKDVNALINRYQELSQNSNLQIYLSAGSSDFVTLCRKFIAAKYKNAHVKIQDINVGPVFTDILAEISTLKWDNVDIFRFFRTSGTTGEIYVRDFHGHMQDIKADRGYCITAGTFSEDCHKYTESRPIDLIEKMELIKVLKVISI
ncbi:MAG: tetratricopeptide repeat protein [Treponema sp.]|nr:tetratricopeptide repeat protein [Treponema sp.]